MFIKVTINCFLNIFYLLMYLKQLKKPIKNFLENNSKNFLLVFSFQKYVTKKNITKQIVIYMSHSI